jgi:hypothetical protein
MKELRVVGRSIIFRYTIYEKPELISVKIMRKEGGEEGKRSREEKGRRLFLH